MKPITLITVEYTKTKDDPIGHITTYMHQDMINVFDRDILEQGRQAVVNTIATLVAQIALLQYRVTTTLFPLPNQDNSSKMSLECINLISSMSEESLEKALNALEKIIVEKSNERV